MKINNKLFFVKDLKDRTTLAFKLVYLTNPILYFGISILVFVSFWIFFNLIDQLLFFSPILYFYIPDDAFIGFIITNTSSALLGIVASMNVYLIKNSRLRLDRSLLSGSILGVVSAACASCSSIGFLIISAFGGVGIIATGFLTNYQIPLRLLSILIMIWALYVVINRVTKSCVINDYQNEKKKKT